MAIHVRLLAKGLTGLGVIATALSVGIVKKDDIYHHFYPNDNRELNDKIKTLGITACQLGNGESTKTCVLNKAKIENIKFDGKAGESLTTDNASLTLTIEKGYEDFRDPNQSNNLYFPEGLRFIFKNTTNGDVTISSGTNQITFKSQTTYDYKIKTEGENKTLEKAWDLGSINEIAGVECRAQSNGGSITECSFRAANVNVWKNEGNNKFGLSLDPTDPSSSQKKIKVDKDSSGYRQGIKFYVEEEITLKTDLTILQDYPLNKETSYEIDIREATIYSGQSQRKEKKWFLVDKSTAKLNEKIKALGISDCDLVEGQTKTSECELEEGKVKNINFTNKTDSDLTVSGLNPNKKLKLVIERDYKDSDFPSGLRFTFTNSNENEVTIGEDSDSNKITLKGNTSYDFKIKTDAGTTKLEKAWTLVSLSKKLGITCAQDTDTECTFGETISVWKGENNYIMAATGVEGKKICVTKDTPEYHQEFKFTLEDSEVSITPNVSGNTKKGDLITKLTKNNMSYGIDVKDIGGVKKWFLVEKATSAPQESQ